MINWKIICILLCCCVQYVEIYTEQRKLADSGIFLFSFEGNCCESYRLIREPYGEYAPSQDTYEQRVRRFKFGDFDVADKYS